jgi:metallo-beta-lactamase class B
MKRSITTSIFYLFLLSNIFGQAEESKLKIVQLTGDFYVYTTYHDYKGDKVSANGMYLVTNRGAVLFDSPWDTTQFQPLLDSIWTRHHQKVTLCIATHFHEDRTAGLAYYSQQGIKTFTTKQTDELSKSRGMKRAAFLINSDTIFSVAQYHFQTYYPGHGHAPDNIVIWFEKEKILYGGCLIKSVEDNTLGNLSDANVKQYATTIKNVIQKCKKPSYIITGHSDWTNTKSLKHTLHMAKKIKNEK